MTRHARLLLLCLAAVAALAVGGCGNKTDVLRSATTEGPYLDLDELKYQVQISRILNPHDVEDRSYLKGVSEGVAPGRDEVWFAIFMRVQNETKQTRTPADTFVITDTQEQRFTALNLDENVNVFAYKPTPIPAGQLIPQLNTPASDNTIQGSLLLFKVKIASLYNRPLELHISSSRGGPEAIVDLDI